MNHTYFVQEAFWVLFTYGLSFFLVGLAASSVLVFLGVHRSKRHSRLGFLILGILILWIAMFVSVEYGYNAWQSIPNPPDDAFSDTGGPFFMLFMGWVPSGVILGLEYFLLRLCRGELKSANSSTSVSRSISD